MQSAYREHHSTKTAALKVVSDIFNASDAGHVTLLALLDLSAAFDTVDHDILLHQLNHSYGIGGAVLGWLRLFLSGRQEVISCASQQSTRSSLSCGVPQGSVGSPILFNLYFADVIRIAHSFEVTGHCYADDLQLYIHCRVRDSAAAAARLLRCIEIIDKWFSSNRLKMNLEKTQLIWLGTRQQLGSFVFTTLLLHDGTTIMPSENFRNLCLIFDSQMTMAEHVNTVTRNCFYNLRHLRFIRRSLSPDTTKLLIHAFISSRIDYCNSLLFGTTDTVARKLQAVLNASAPYISRLRRYDHISSVLKDELHWLPVEYRISTVRV